ncbi:protein neprosin-like [Cicer arietinum]
MSSAYIWLTNETNVGNANTIHAGWQASPDITGDTLTHFFISWNNNVQHTGCTNMLCPGFVQTSSRIYLGSPILNVSVYGGPIFSMSLSLTQDKATNNWWLRAQNEDVGYFPAEIFSNNFLYASKGGWTGHTKFFTNAPAPQMGSGHFPDRNPLHSGYISRIYFKDRYRQDFGPLRSNVISYADNIRCYDVKYYDYVDDILQRVLMYGGPGGNCGN